jgi:hypothetical protein
MDGSERVSRIIRGVQGDDDPRSDQQSVVGAQMAKKGITGHDEWVITEALATALVALEQLPPVHQPRTHMDDVRKLLAAGCQPGSLNLHLAQAKCRLFPGSDPLSIYREYGLEDEQG